jgi:hypothetical protein
MARARKTARKPAAENAPKAEMPKPAAKVLPGRKLVTVVNRSHRMLSFNLPHAIYCKRMGQCFCKQMDRVVSFVSKVDKQRHTKVDPVLTCKSITIRHGETVELPQAALDCPEIQAALKQRWLLKRS